MNFIGPYKLIRRLGEGGMGQVWLAEQSVPVQRQVAVKLIRAGMYDAGVVLRFRSEQQSLAMMNHPAIAKVFDAGATLDGQPYFVMEYVPGFPITDYCDERRLTVRERLELFVQVCGGVQHAHQKAVIHRDLKPANILVTEVDGKPKPRIIDFGLAKATGPQLGDETLMTRAGAWVGTPGYMSPEQADPAADVDTRTDVYSLGVLLYALLTGDQPFDMMKWQKQPFFEVMRELREVDPPNPSTKIRMLRVKESAKDRQTPQANKASSISSAELRRVQAGQLEVLLRGDLDWITMKALEKDRGRRYGSPAELAADIERYLTNEPIVARPASRSYRARKYIRRHRVAVGAASGLVLLLGVFLAVQAVQVRRVTRERDRATRERDRATRITDFMQQIFKVSDPSEARGNSIKARDLLDNASKEIDTGLAKDPEAQAQMMQVIGEVYGGLGLYPQSESLVRRALEIRRRVLGPDSPDTLESRNKLAALLIIESRFPEAERLERETLGVERRVLGADDPRTIDTMLELTNTLDVEGRHSEAEQQADEMLVHARRALPPESHESFRVLREMSMLRWNQDRAADAESFAREALAIAQPTLGADHPDTMKCIALLSGILEDQGKYAEAEKLERGLIETQTLVLGPEHPHTLASLSGLAAALYGQARYPEAERLERSTLEAQQRVAGPEDVNTLVSMLRLGMILSAEGRYSEAETIQRKTLELQRKVLGLDNFDTILSIGTLGETLMKEGHYEESDKMLREALEAQRRVLSQDNPDIATTLYDLSVVAAHLGKKQEATSWQTQAVDEGLKAAAKLKIKDEKQIASLYSNPRFAALVIQATQSADAAGAAQVQAQK